MVEHATDNDVRATHKPQPVAVVALHVAGQDIARPWTGGIDDGAGSDGLSHAALRLKPDDPDILVTARRLKPGAGADGAENPRPSSRNIRSRW